MYYEAMFQNIISEADFAELCEGCFQAPIDMAFTIADMNYPEEEATIGEKVKRILAHRCDC
jgi:hypothetical protein